MWRKSWGGESVMSKHYVKRYISTLPYAHDRTGNDIVVRATNVLLIVKQETREGVTEGGGCNSTIL